MKIKICGVTRHQDARLAAGLGAWAVGFVFYSKSKRLADAKMVGDILVPVPKVGVFVDQTNEVEALVRTARLDMVQLHGNETPQECEALRRATGKPVIKAFRPSSPKDVERMAAYRGSVDYVLVDAFVEGSFGGTGRRADWNLAREMKQSGIPLVLSGGIDAQNLIAAKREVDPFAFDLSSSVEEAPGLKSEAKLRQLFDLAQGL